MLYIGLDIYYKYEILDGNGNRKNRIMNLSAYLPKLPFEEKEESNKYALDLIQRIQSSCNGKEIKGHFTKYFEYPLYGDAESKEESDYDRFFKDYQEYKKIRKAALLLGGTSKESIERSDIYEILNTVSELLTGRNTKHLVQYDKIGNEDRLKTKIADDFYQKYNWNPSRINTGFIAVYVWKSILAHYGNSLSEKYGYRAGNRFGDHAEVPFWKNPNAKSEVDTLYMRGINYALDNLAEVKNYYGEQYRGRNASLQAYLMKEGHKEYSGDHLKDRKEQYIDSSKLIECLNHIISKILMSKTQYTNISADFMDKKANIEVNSVIEGLYMHLITEYIAGVKYRKCELCDNFFISDQTSRKYCDLHRNAKTHHKRKMKEKFKTD